MKTQESFNSRLKAEGDENSTNLYISNLPKTMTESVALPKPLFARIQANTTYQELGAIFMDYTVSSSRILRDPQTHMSRGVGFAR